MAALRCDAVWGAHASCGQHGCVGGPWQANAQARASGIWAPLPPLLATPPWVRTEFLRAAVVRARGVYMCKARECEPPRDGFRTSALSPRRPPSRPCPAVQGLAVLLSSFLFMRYADLSFSRSFSVVVWTTDAAVAPACVTSRMGLVLPVNCHVRLVVLEPFQVDTPSLAPPAPSAEADLRFPVAKNLAQKPAQPQNAGLSYLGST